MQPTANSLFTTRVYRFPVSQQEGKAFALFAELEAEGRLSELTTHSAKVLLGRYQMSKTATPILSLYRANPKYPFLSA